MSKSEGIGASVRRTEDFRLLAGHGRYVGNIVLPGELRCHVVRSPHAHARIRAVRAGRAAAQPGVVAVFTGHDMAADGVGPMRSLWEIRSRDGQPMAEPPRWALARDSVRHVGEPVAVVIAETPEAAVDAAEQLEVDYAELPAVTASRDALREGAPRLHEEAPGNVCFRWARGDAAAVRDAFESAAHVTRIDLVEFWDQSIADSR